MTVGCHLVPCPYSGRNYCSTRIFPGWAGGLEAPLVCLQQGWEFENVGTWNTGVMALTLDACFLILLERFTECPASYPGFTDEQDAQRVLPFGGY